MLGPSYGYVQSRLAARHGGRLSAADWRRLAASGLLGSYLQGIRRTALEPWVRRFSDAATHHAIELSLRAQWRAYVVEVAHWPPTAWTEAVIWVDRLWDLPVALELCRGGQIGAWAKEDSVYRQWIDREGSQSDAMARHLGHTVFTACVQNGDVSGAWGAEWRRRWPATTNSIRAGLGRLSGTVERHLKAMASAQDPRTGGALRADLEGRLVRLFRSYARTPVALFAHLGLVAIDLERLRAALVQRTLFATEQRA